MPTCRRVKGIASLRHSSKVRGQPQNTDALIPEPTVYEAGLAPQPLWTFRRAYTVDSAEDRSPQYSSYTD